MKFVVFLILLAIGLVFVIRTDNVVGVFGRFAWAERNLGATGTYTFYKLLGIFLIFCGALYASGLVNRMLDAMLGFLFPPQQ